MHFRKKAFFLLLLVLLAICCRQQSYAQKLLSKKITLTVNKKPLNTVLDNISRQGGFYFSYISTTIHNDSLVTLSVHDKTVRQVLETLFGDRYQYRETDNHVIIQPASKEKWFVITGTVTDGYTGLALSDASVFERQYLASTLTTTNGSFRLLLKESDKYPVTQVTISMGTFYTDTTILFPQGIDQHINVALRPSNHTLEDFEVTQYSGVERSWLGRTLFSSKLRKQSANLGKFFVEKKFQASLTPGLGTHGKLSGQVTNTFSFNALGGYAAGVDGFELGGLFNIDKKDVKYVQIAGLFNVVSGKTDGVQIAGISNYVHDSMTGLQVSGINNHIKGSVQGMTIAGLKGNVEGSFRGMQLSGLYNKIQNRQGDTLALKGMQLAGLRNKAHGNVSGIQLAGLINKARGNVNGAQVAGMTNKARGEVSGAQIAVIYNRAKKVKGVQIGFINVADTVDGYSIGFLNIIKKGYHTLCISSDEVFNTNVSFLGGNKNLYGIYRLGYNFNANRKAWGLGYGIGTQLLVSKRVAVLAELTYMTMYTSDTTVPSIVKFRTGFNIECTHWLAFHFGPSISLGSPPLATQHEGYQRLQPDNNLYMVGKGRDVISWIGWQVGVNIF